MKNYLLLLIIIPSALLAQNIDPYNNDSQYAFGENVGWLNFQPTYGDGVKVSSTTVKGYLWAENIGWVNLSPSYGGVANDGFGHLSGYAWGENVGWINFNPTYGGVSIAADGKFSGYAWGENIGWINFNVTNKVQACKVCYDDLANFVAEWLHTNRGNPADLNTDLNVNMLDFNVLASYWLDFCPDAWSLK